MGVTDDQLWWLLERSLDAARSQVGALWTRGEDVADILNPLREAQLALAARTQPEQEEDPTVRERLLRAADDLMALEYKPEEDPTEP